MVSWKMEHFDAMVSRWSAETLQLCWIRGHEDMTDQGGGVCCKAALQRPAEALPRPAEELPRPAEELLRCHALLKSCHTQKIPRYALSGT